MAESVLLKLKSANGAAAFYLVARTSWRVSQLKNVLEAHHPSHPPALCQKLVFAGAILKDSNTLAHVFAKLAAAGSSYDADGVTMHLVFPASNVNAEALPNSPLTAPAPRLPGDADGAVLPKVTDKDAPALPDAVAQQGEGQAEVGGEDGFTLPRVEAVYSPLGSPTLVPVASPEAAMAQYYATYYAEYYRAWYEAQLADGCQQPNDVASPLVDAVAAGNGGEMEEAGEAAGGEAEAEAEADAAVGGGGAGGWLRAGVGAAAWAAPMLVKCGVLLSMLAPAITTDELMLVGGLAIAVVIAQMLIRFHIQRRNDAFNERVRLLREAREAAEAAAAAAAEIQAAQAADDAAAEATAAPAEADAAAQAAARLQQLQAEQNAPPASIVSRVYHEAVGLLAPFIMSLFPAYRPPDRVPDHLLQPAQPPAPPAERDPAVPVPPAQ
ncbi:uncharacterized protein AMSG_09584 [Thecamonas trahens ATCC 50062]|uniref:Ubiquitin-like domain-containing protein n=1 Tax=Thecamonas trahens ATCC 50062 TaxID=461836 RepID=A0A0L0DNU5_THETB|nr:hypothetical protein AMSG_09584 [Thecamonas trahens ATCC 50062]KNC53940.1 hypothetical protein AMSG_09584 [Thecamonas trahens ATCC 50062]|eukprot:XP_013754143.1 hypothetical protein AMSG_09584 [Thecamonas trahens ATCC 50062]